MAQYYSINTGSFTGDITINETLTGTDGPDVAFDPVTVLGDLDDRTKDEAIKLYDEHQFISAKYTLKSLATKIS